MFKLKKIKNWIIFSVLGVGTVLAAGQVTPESTPDCLLLETNKENIIGHKDIGIKEFKKCEEDKKIKKVKREAVKYVYKTHKIKDEPNEIVSKRTGNSKTYKLNEESKDGEEMYKIVIYSGEPQFYKHLETGDWFKTERAVTTKKEFKKQTKTSSIDRIFGRAYAADATYYPDPNAESSSVDGHVWHDEVLTWNNLVNAVGDNSDDTSTGASFTQLYTTSSAGQWWKIIRSIFLFDTSASSGNTIESAIFSLYGTTKIDSLSITPDINVYSSAPASNTALAAGDFDSLGTTAYCDTAITYAGWSTVGYNTFTINAAGITFIQTAVDGDGIVKFGARNVNYDVCEELDAGCADPAWSSNSFSYLDGYFADQAGTDNDPKLELTYVAGADRRIIIEQ